MAERWVPTMAETIPSTIHLLGLRDDEEGFRVLLQDKSSMFVYAMYADAVFYRRHSYLTALSAESPAQPDKSGALIFPHS